MSPVVTLFNDSTELSLKGSWICSLALRQKSEIHRELSFHVETVVQLVRKKPDTYIDITVDMDELDLTSSEAKATYDEIKDYIFDTYRVKVSSLYIAQVKQKHGIIERDC